MAATQPVRRPWDSVDDGLWADAAAAADAESAPSNGEKGAGHVQNTGYTSGRANWLWAAVAEWLQRVRDTLLPQHTDAGGHTDVTVVGASGSPKLTITSSSGEAASIKMIDANDADGELGFSVDKEGDVVCRTQQVGDVTAGVGAAGDVVKLDVESTDTDAAATKQIRLLNTAGDVAFAVTTAGVVLDTGTLEWGPVDFSGISLADRAAIEQVVTGEHLYASPNDATTYYAHARVHLTPGEQIQGISLHGNRPTAGGQTLVLSLRRRTPTQVGSTEVGAVTLGAGTGEISTASGAVTYTIVAGEVYYWRLALNNNTAGGGNQILFRGIDVDYAIP